MPLPCSELRPAQQPRAPGLLAGLRRALVASESVGDLRLRNLDKGTGSTHTQCLACGS